MQTINTIKLKELGFIEDSISFRKEVGKSTDRFMTTIIFDKEEEEFLFMRRFTSRDKFIDEEEIIRNNNELHTGAKEAWLKIKEMMELEVVDQ